MLLEIYVREYRRGNEKGKIQRNMATKGTQDEEKQSENTTQYGRFHYSTCSELLSKHEKSMYIQYLRLVVYLIHPVIITFEEIVTCRH